MDYLLTTLGIGVALAVLAFTVWVIWILVEEGIGLIYMMTVGADNLEMAYIISSEDIESLTRADRKELNRMSYQERKASLEQRFPFSVPELHSCLAKCKHESHIS